MDINSALRPRLRAVCQVADLLSIHTHASGAEIDLRTVSSVHSTPIARVNRSWAFTLVQHSRFPFHRVSFTCLVTMGLVVSSRLMRNFKTWLDWVVDSGLLASPGSSLAGPKSTALWYIALGLGIIAPRQVHLADCIRKRTASMTQ